MKKLQAATPYIACYVVLNKDGRVPLLLREKVEWMSGYYGLCQGKVEEGESYTQAVVREAQEELGIKVDPKGINHVLTMHRREPGNYAAYWVDVYFEVTNWEGEPKNAEPHKHAQLIWADVNGLPENTIPGVRLALEQIQTGKTYVEYGFNDT